MTTITKNCIACQKYQAVNDKRLCFGCTAAWLEGMVQLPEAEAVPCLMCGEPGPEDVPCDCLEEPPASEPCGLAGCQGACAGCAPSMEDEAREMGGAGRHWCEQCGGDPRYYRWCDVGSHPGAPTE